MKFLMTQRKTKDIHRLVVHIKWSAMEPHTPLLYDANNNKDLPVMQNDLNKLLLYYHTNPPPPTVSLTYMYD